MNNPPVTKKEREDTGIRSTPDRVCSACGNQVSADAKFCGSCGKPIEEVQGKIIPLCPRCGLPMKLGYCLVCDKVIVARENPPSRICPHCAMPIGQNDKFCRSCGKNTVYM